MPALAHPNSSSFFLPHRCCRSCRIVFRSLFPVALDHDHAQKAPDDGGAKQDQDDGDANGPDARGEEVVQGVPGIDKRLGREMLGVGREKGGGRGSGMERKGEGEEYHEESPGGVVEKDSGGEDEHCQTDEFVELDGRKWWRKWVVRNGDTMVGACKERVFVQKNEGRDFIEVDSREAQVKRTLN